MDAQIIKELIYFNNNNLLKFKETDRFLYKDIDQKINTFLKKGGLNIILLTGLRGTGKTTILKTIAKKYSGLYTSGDFLKLKNIDLNNLTEFSKSHSKKIIIIDEILYISDWQLKLKIDADTNQDILYIISGSSAIQLKKITQDLSRRLDVYKLYPLSFREFLKINQNLDLNIDLNINDLINLEKKELFLKLLDIKLNLPENIYLLYKEYLENQFPFLLFEKNKKQKLKELIEKVIYKDLPQIENFNSEQLRNAELILKFLTTTEKINYTTISNNLDIKKDMVIKIINLLESAELLYFVQDIVPTRELRSNKKILFTSSEVRNALNETNSDFVVGFSREDVFGLILKMKDIPFAYNYNQNGFDYLIKTKKFEIGNNKNKISKDVIVISDILDVEYKNEILIIPFYLFSLIN
jgi:uncharacterized protein